ncbi:MAG TPA: hypothetical protein PL033_10625 [Candidatus Brocadiia bacterium]|nr:hypothetical protein [Candidatus Brocadiia bacterium]
MDVAPDKTEYAEPEGGRGAVICPGCGVAIPADALRCPKCGRRDEAVSAIECFPIEADRIPRPWKAFLSAWLLLTKPKDCWAAIRGKGNLRHIFAFWLMWQIIGINLYALRPWNFIRVWVDDPPFRNVGDVFGLALGISIIALVVQLTLYVCLRIVCFVNWAPRARLGGVMYVLAMMPLAMAATRTDIWLGRGFWVFGTAYQPFQSLQLLWNYSSLHEIVFYDWGANAVRLFLLVVFVPPFLKHRCGFTNGWAAVGCFMVPLIALSCTTALIFLMAYL